MKINSFIKKLLFSFLLLMLFLNTVIAFSNNLKEVNVIETNMDVNNVSIEDNKIIDDIVFTKKDDYIVLEFKIQNNDDYIYKIEDIVDNNTNDNILITYDYLNEEINKQSDYKFRARLEYKNQLENVKKIDINDLKITIKLSTVDGKDKDIIVNPVTKDSVLYYLVLLILSLIGVILIMVKKKKILGFPLLILVCSILLPIGIFAIQKYEYDVFIKHIEIKGVMLPYNVNFNVLDKDPITKVVIYGEEITELPIVNEPGYEFIEWQDQDGNKIDEHTIVTGELNVTAKLELIPYTITFDLNGGHYEEGKENLNIYYVDSEDIILNNPVKEGYSFSGWTGSNGDVLQTKVTISKGTTGNLTYTANYLARDDTEYTVIHRKQKLTLDGYEEADIDTLRGVTDTVVRPETNNYTGFISPDLQELTITPDGNATLTYDYDREYYNYEVDDNTISSIPEGSYPYETEAIIEPKDIPGYTFEKWNDDNPDNPRTLIIERDIIGLKPIYTPNTNTTYTVIHRFQNEDYTTYTEEIENKTGTTDTEVTPGIRIRDGFIEPELQTGIIKGDGSLVITYIYDRTRTAILDTGDKINIKFKKISGNTDVTANSADSNIKSIVRSYQEPDLSNMTNDNIISSSDSTAPVYAWYDNGTIYYYSNEDVIYMNRIAGHMFYSFKQLETIDLNSFDTSNVISMNDMFFDCSNLTSIDLSNFDTRNVTNMGSMFAGCSSLTTLDLSNFDTSNVNDMGIMFSGCSSLTTLDLSNFNTISVKNMSSMFSGCSGLTTLDLSNWDTRNVTTMSNMFSGCSGLTTLDLSNFNTSNVTGMTYMFNDCLSLTTLDLSNFNTISVKDMSSMFAGCSSLTTLDLSNWNTSNVTTMSNMFSRCSNLTSLNLSNWDTGNVTTMSKMFNNCSKLSFLDLTHFKIGNVKNMEGMFNNCSSLVTLDLSNWDTSNSIIMKSMFSGCSSLTSLNLSNWNTSNVKNMEGMFTNCSSLTSLDIGHFNTSNVTFMSSMFHNCSSLTSLDISNWITGNVKEMDFMFYNCSSLASLELSDWNTGNVTTMRVMFYNCSSLTTLDLSDWNTSNVKNMEGMFYNCSSLASLELSNWITSNVTNMQNMFRNCSNLTSLDLSNFNTNNITNMLSMFNNCSSLTSIDLSHFNTSSVTNMGGMFSNCSSLTSIDLSNFDTSSVTNMSGMFGSCSSLTSIDLSNFDTSSVTNMSGMFTNCSNITSIDLSNFDTSKVTNMSTMFSICQKLKTVYVSDKWNTINLTSSEQMFRQSIALVGGAGTTYNSGYIDKTYARIDGGVDSPGYFTYKDPPLGASISVFKNMFNGGNKIILIISSIGVIILGLILLLVKHKNKKKS